MTKKLLIGYLILFLSYSGVVYGQATDNWYFGLLSGLRVSFTSGTPVVTRGYPLVTQEGSSSISDFNGNILFYTDGVKVWDRTNTQIATGLNGGPSGTQSATIVPKPGTSNQWYIFTGGQDPSSGGGADGGENYNIVTSLPGGTFTVSGATALRASGTVGEHICITGSTKPGATYWVISHEKGTNNILAFEVNTATGVVSTPVISNAGGVTLNSWIGTVKANGCQNQLAFTYYNESKVELYNFNSATGSVTGLVASITQSAAYGVEFSPNDQFLYYTSLVGGTLYQYNILSGATPYTQGSWTKSGEMGQLQLAPDGKIYVALPGGGSSSEYLGIINSPSTFGSGANFVLNGLQLNTVPATDGYGYRGLPTFPKSLVISNVSINPSSSSFCTGNPQNISYTFAGASASQTWTINPGSGWTYTAGTSTSASPIITFNTPNTYTITSTVFDICGRTYTDRAIYSITDPLIPSGTICTAAGVSVTLAASGGNAALYPRYVWFANATSTSPIGIGSSVTLNYSDPTRVPSTIWVEVSSTATSIGSGSNTLAGSALDGAAEASPYGPVPFSVLANNVRFKSFVVKTWTGSPGNFDVVIRNASNAIVFQKTYSIATNGTNYTVDINTNFQTGSYTITLTNTGMQWYRGTWPGQSVANQFNLPFFGNGTYSLANVAYDYSNFTYTPTCSNRIAVSSCIPLPINLIKFSGELIENKVDLKWSTSSETNNDRFEIQRSLDGIHFSTIKTIKGAGNSSRITEYTTTDHSPAPKTNYYRLVQYDVDGKESISEVISVNVISEELDFTISPNPSTNTFNLYLKNINSGEISITDLLGKLVFSKTLSSEVNLFEFGEDLVKGAYVVKVSSTNGSATKLIIKE